MTNAQPSEPVLATVTLVLGICHALLPALQIMVPTWLIASRLPHRHPHSRGILAGALTLSVFLALTVAEYYSGPPQGSAMRLMENFGLYALLMLMLFVDALVSFETSAWMAAFCVTSGYTLQNLSSGLTELIRIALVYTHKPPLEGIWDVLVSTLLLALVCLTAWHLFVRRVVTMRTIDHDNHQAVLMIALVMLVVIAFDVIVRGMEARGTPLGFLMALRLVHTTVSLFVLYAEYEMLFNARLRQRMATSELLMSERERQYQLSRENIAAMDRRVHDVRHEVFRVLDEKGALAAFSRESLRAVLRELDVFDARVQTGNTALDTVLTERSLMARAEDITLTCLADGHALDALEPPELYALLEGLLDYAFAAAHSQSSRDLRSISFSVRRFGELALMHLECYGTAAVPTRPQRIVECHGGSMTSKQRGEATVVDVMLPRS